MNNRKKATILFPLDLYEQLAHLAKRRETSVGELVRNACRAQYSLFPKESRLAAVKQLSSLGLPVGTPEEMERESVPPAAPHP